MAEATLKQAAAPTADKAAVRKVLDAVKQYGGTVIRSSLTRDAEARLQQALDTGAMTQSMGTAQDASAQI